MWGTPSDNPRPTSLATWSHHFLLLRRLRVLRLLRRRVRHLELLTPVVPFAELSIEIVTASTDDIVWFVADLSHILQKLFSCRRHKLIDWQSFSFELCWQKWTVDQRRNEFNHTHIGVTQLMAQTHGEWVKSGCNTVISHNLNNLSLWFYLWLRSRLGDWRVERMRRWMSRWQWEHWPSVGSEAREAPTNAWEPTSWLEILPCALTSQSQKCLWVKVGKDQCRVRGANCAVCGCKWV